MARHINLALSNKYLELILLPTEKCNFDCLYCYEVNRKPTMPDHVIEGLKGLISKRAPMLSTLNLVWFGGEPLLAMSVIRSVMEHTLNIKRDFTSFNLLSTIYTNGYQLDLGTATILCQLNIGWFHLTLDGWQPEHDRVRRLANGRGTFEKIWDNLLQIRDSVLEVQIRVRIHYTPDHWNGLEKLLEEVNVAFGGDQRFSFYFRPISRWGGPNDELIECCTQEKHIQISSALKDSFCKQEMLANVPDEPVVCYAAQANSFVIRSNGDILKCIIPMDAKVNNIGRVEKDGTFVIDSKKLNRWVSTLGSEGSLRGRSCPYGESVLKQMDL